MQPSGRPGPHPLDDPLAVAAGGLVLVALVRGGLLPLPLGITAGVLTTITLAAWRRRRRFGSGSQRRHEARLDAGLDDALRRASELAAQAEVLGQEALLRFTDAAHLEGLGAVRLCCERLQALPGLLARCRPLLEAGAGVLVPPERLARRLAGEEQALRRESEGPLRRERARLVDQLRRNLEAARLGMDEREARLLALATCLEAIDGGLRQLRRQIDRQWPGSDHPAPTLAAAIAPLDGALDRIDDLLGEAPP
jgi:hypothetical protein